MRKACGQIGRARGTQNRRLNAVCTSPLTSQLQLWRTFQPVPREDRSVLIGVGQSRHQCRNHAGTGTRLQPGLNMRHQSVLRSQFWNVASQSYTQSAIWDAAWPLGFFGEGMPARAWAIAADAALAARVSALMVSTREVVSGSNGWRRG